MQRPFYCLFIGLFFVLFAACNGTDNSSAQEQDAAEQTTEITTPVTANENTFTLGESFGKLTKGMDLIDAEEIYGEDLTEAELPGGEGTTFPGYKLFAGTDREVWLTYMPARRLNVMLNENATMYQDPATGLRVGMTLQELEKLNGKPFTFAGFGWDYGGFVRDWQGGKLGNAGITTIRLSYDYMNFGPDDVEAVSGEDAVRSDNEIVRELGVKVREIVLGL